MSVYYAQLVTDDDTIQFEGSARGAGLLLSPDGIEGWYGTPDAKVSMTERGQGDGAHDIDEQDILYAARTVTMYWSITSDTGRAETLDYLMAVTQTAHRLVKLRVVDADMDTYVEGYATHTIDAKRHDRLAVDCRTTLVCPRPERLGWSPCRYMLSPALRADGGMYFAEISKGLVFPLRYGERNPDASNRCVISNAGSSRAYPVYTLGGDWPNGVALVFNGDRSLTYTGSVQVGHPVVLDSRARTATLDGVDVSQYLAKRDFPTVPPFGELQCTLLSAGGVNAGVSVLCRDTYM
ncbi:hypothetical protein DSM100688_0385 [Bifidobacterium ramosum]|uniref:Uncharacterized protein n=1 Tax=Bifidobacterium ramosum TaxID=1798158 RepID=A0A6L4X2V0_9BIFI|nr:hypothetical protein [Bifidobacterium ramosum]KAB8289305.1 hypothetical protein DSM100688_0385 [Bifidobacterium ramosum]NEG71010.1 hypothetical protein [Bifidobacterium ramosum]